MPVGVIWCLALMLFFFWWFGAGINLVIPILVIVALVLLFSRT